MSDVTKVLPENIKIWVDALRSGDYPQCQGTLYNGLGFCCVGVYADVHKIATEEVMLRHDDIDATGDMEGPVWVYDKIKEEVDVDVVEAGICMNDYGKSFNLIADMIENHYLGDGTVPGDTMSTYSEDFKAFTMWFEDYFPKLKVAEVSKGTIDQYYAAFKAGESYAKR